MTPEELKELLDKGEKVRIIDVREKEEYEGSSDRFSYQPKDEQGNPVGDPITAENIPMGKVYTEAKKGNISKGERIVTICASGKRCRHIATNMKDEDGYWMDYLDGGLEKWNS